MKKIFEICLGVVTSVGGFLEMGSLSTAAQGGAAFRLQLVWPIVVGTLCIIFLTEMAGRFAAVSQHTIAAGIRDRFGIKFFLLPFVAVLIVNTLVLSAEIGGVSVALEMATGLKHPWWALPVALLAWFTLWRGTFGLIEKGVSLLGLVTLSFVAAAVTLKPDWHQVAAGVLPSVPHHDPANYWFIVVSILGASITPSLFLFYSSGAVEDQWDSGYLGANRAIATLGMAFGGCISVAVLVAAAYVFPAHGITRVDDYHQLPLLLVAVFGFWGFVLFVASLAFACFGAILQIALEQAYLVAQGFGWNWGENRKPRDDPGFCLVYTCALAISAIPIAAGVDPLKLTVFSMALTAVSLPLTVVPFLVLMNDERYVGRHGNGVISNTVVVAIIVLAFVLAIVALPLQVLGGA
ncbi:NRAMP family divalent metal transporter [Paraburkholderia terricola]|uniref:Mn2+ and Fe2+ transporters of the NRAMP family n=1 Tax=Paraburkholderia terricola TaxID=169427 RepID=A0A1M6M2Y0_9BURK|nr:MULTISPECIES: divalent metal cation transporter [Paraburkholderia]SDN94375.1 Mn2+ and Fe2+ transporters of the NRAMP family [Paraburkholderia sediminicola]SHJ77822.1 Mn2+ and Fe2+ transporters of the NRAMP family [Paraburkholderia terricola]